MAFIILPNAGFHNVTSPIIDPLGSPVETPFTYDSVGFSDYDLVLTINDAPQVVGMLVRADDNIANNIVTSATVRSSTHYQGGGDLSLQAVIFDSVDAAETTVNVLGGGWLVNIAAGDKYELGCIQAGSFAPAQFNRNVRYTNKTSERGEFVGRAIVSSSAVEEITPLEIDITPEFLSRFGELRRYLETRPVYLCYEVGNVKYVSYGWLDAPPNLGYTGDVIQGTQTFNFRRAG